MWGTMNRRMAGKSFSLFGLDKRRGILLVGACILATAVACVLAGCGSTTAEVTAEVPDLEGKTLSEAKQAVKSVSSDWEVKTASNSGKTTALLRMHSAMHKYAKESDNDLVVTSVEPKSGSVLEKGEKQVIEVRMQPPQDELKTLKKARAKALKVKSVTKKMKKDGWGKRELKDHGTYVTYRWTLTHGTSDGIYDYSPSDFVKDNKGKWKKVAKALGSSVIACGYTKDGYLVGVFTDMYPKADKAEKKNVRNQVKAITRRADQYADKHAKKYVKNLMSWWKKGNVDSRASADYVMTRKRATIYFKTGFDNPYWTGDAADVDKTRTAYRILAKWSTQMLRRDVTIKFLKGDGSVWDSFSAKCQKWPKVA